MELPEKIKKIIGGKNIFYIAALGVGILLLIFASGFSSPKADATPTTAEIRLQTILEKIEGVESVSVMISLKDDNRGNARAEGVVIVASGANNAQVKKCITEAATAALGIPTHKVQVFEHKK